MTKSFTIFPLYDYIQLSIEKAKLGNIDTSSMKTGQEYATILAIGPDVKNKDLKVGDNVFINSWATEIKLYDKKEYFFISEERGGIVAKIV